jgi:hypothetical protein
MKSTWADAARAMIQRAHEHLGTTATLDQRRKLLRSLAEEFHGGTSWGKKIWSRESRRYLEQHGLPPRPALGVKLSARQQQLLAKTKSQHARLAAADVTFPFRQKEEGYVQSVS